MNERVIIYEIFEFEIQCKFIIRTAVSVDELICTYLFLFYMVMATPLLHAWSHSRSSSPSVTIEMLIRNDRYTEQRSCESPNARSSFTRSTSHNYYMRLINNERFMIWFMCKILKRNQTFQHFNSSLFLSHFSIRGIFPIQCASVLSTTTQSLNLIPGATWPIENRTVINSEGGTSDRNYLMSNI